MQSEFWLQQWREGHIGFHRSTPMPLLLQHWPSLGLAPGTRVLVPLCGKSLDMLWLAEQGLEVLGVELSPLAIEQFLHEHELSARTHRSALGTHYRAGRIEIIHGNVFALDADTLSSCQAIYDRAAIVALPPSMRARYAHTVYGQMAAGTQALTLTLEYPPAEMDGPPFPVSQDNLEALLGPRWAIELLERRDILATEPKFHERGLSSFHTGVFRLHCRPA